MGRWRCRICGAEWDARNASMCPACRSFLITLDSRSSTLHERQQNEIQVINNMYSAITTRLNRPESPTFQRAAHDVLRMSAFYESLRRNPILLGTIHHQRPPPQPAEEYRPLTPSTYKHRHIHKKDMKQEAVCSICYEDFKYHEKVCELPCGHVFHDTCIREWFKRDPSCPMCRKELGDKPPPPQPNMDDLTTYIFLI